MDHQDLLMPLSKIHDIGGECIDWEIHCNCSGTLELLEIGSFSRFGLIKATSPGFIDYDSVYY